MFGEMPDPWPLWLAKQRQEELIHEADQHRLAREAERYRLATADPREPADRLATRLFNSLRVGVARPLAIVRRVLSGPEEPCDDPCPECALG
jgi:hypothetical protein